MKVLLFDPFLIGICLAIALATLMPATGLAAQWVDVASFALIAVMFFCHGLKVPRRALAAALKDWRLHGLILMISFAVFPALGVGVWLVAGTLLPGAIAAGFFFLCAAPSTVQSSTAFTAIAGGNVPAAIAAAAASSLMGVLVTPLLSQSVLGTATGGITFASLGNVFGLIVLPFACGHLCRPVLGAWADRQGKWLGWIDKSAIIMIVYAAFSAAVVDNIWGRLGWSSFAVVMVVSIGLLAAITVICVFLSGRVSQESGNRPVIIFCGTQKSLAAGVSIAKLIFPAAMVGDILVPLMVYHQLQLILAAALAPRLRT